MDTLFVLGLVFLIPSVVLLVVAISSYELMVNNPDSYERDLLEQTKNLQIGIGLLTFAAVAGASMVAVALLKIYGVILK